MTNHRIRERRPKKAASNRPTHTRSKEQAVLPARPGRARSSDILFLQHTVGNQAITGLLGAGQEASQAAIKPAYFPLRFPIVQRQEGESALPEYPGRLLLFGSSGEEVRAAQMMLNRHGFGLVVDGIFGPLTHQAVVAFQQAQGVAVDGIIGPITWGALAGRHGDGGGTAAPPADQPAGLSPADLQALAATLAATGSDLLIQEPLAGAQVAHFLQATAGDLLAGPATGPLLTTGPALPEETTFQPAIMRSMDRPAVMRQQAPSATPLQAAADPVKIHTLQDVKQLFARILDFIVNDVGKKPVVGPAGGPGDPVRTQVLSLEYIHRYFSPLLAQPWPQTQDPITALARQELELFLHRTAALRGFYNSVLPPGTALPGDETTSGHMPSQNRPADSRRLRIAGNGLADLGKVKAAEVDGDKRRIGYQHLQVIFDTAWPTHRADGVPDSLIEKKKTGKKLRHGGNKDNPDDYVTGDLLPSWCGVGATYWAKKTDASFPDWVMGIGVVNKLDKRTRRELPEVGDIVASTSQGHHGVITWVDPAAKAPESDGAWSQIRIKTVEANIKGKIVETPVEPTDHSKLAYWNVGVFKPFK
jgi:peptidoglycan hydrolase-like protein with peptidoglycan-binding domain